MAAPETQGGLVRKEAVDQLSESTKTSSPLTVRAERSRIGSFGSYGMVFLAVSWVLWVYWQYLISDGAMRCMVSRRVGDALCARASRNWSVR